MQAGRRLLGIEISDLGITAAQVGSDGAELIPLDSGDAELSSFAQLSGRGEVIFGQTAFRQFLTSEVPVDNQFWYRFAATEGGASAKKGSKYQPPDSDLAQAHLTAVLGKCLQGGTAFDDVALSVPGHFKASKLGALIQIARDAGFSVNHVLDGSLAGLLSATSVPEGELLVVVDLHWNSADVIRVKRSDTSVERLDVVSDRGLGLRLILDRLIDGVGKRFIDECRFDPAARPEYAQELYNQLMGYMRNGNTSPCKLETTKGSIAVDRAGLARMVENELNNLTSMVKRAVDGAKNGNKSAVFLSSRASLVPGLASLLVKKNSLNPVLFQKGQAALGSLAFLNALDGKDRPVQPLFHTQLEFDNAAAKEASSSANEPLTGKVFVSGVAGILKPTPSTHLLFQGRILPLPQPGEADFVVGKSKSISAGLTIVEPVEGLADFHVIIRRREGGELEMVNNGRNTTELNGESVASSNTVLLQSGDVITLGDSILQLMVVGLVRGDA